MIARLRRRARGDGGAVLVLVAMAMPVLLLFASFVIDAANWWVHSRHLQGQADAAALAAAQAVRPRACDNALINADALKFSGAPGATWNEQLGGTDADDVHFLLNSPTFYGQSKSDPDVTGQPCETKMIDVKMTETDLPWFFDALNVPFINAQARVEIRQRASASRMMPFGVPDKNIRAARVFLVDAADGNELGAEIALGQKAKEGGLDIWGTTKPLSFTAAAGTPSRIGVRVALSTDKSATPTTNCADIAYVKCYDLDSTGNASKELIRISTWSADPTSLADGKPPELRSVFLEDADGDCDSASAPYFNVNTTNCDVKAIAYIDFNEKVTDAHKSETVNGQDRVVVKATLGGKPNTGVTMTWNSTKNRFESPDSLPVPAEGGPLKLNIQWEQRVDGSHIGTVPLPGEQWKDSETCKKSGSNPAACHGEFANAHAVYSAQPDRTLDLKRVEATLTDPETGAEVDSLERCAAGINDTCTYDLDFKIGVEPGYELSGPGDEPDVLHLGSPQRAINQTVLCSAAPLYAGENPPNDYATIVARGCSETFRPFVYGEDTCPANQAELEKSAQPWFCAATKGGVQANATLQGLNERILCDERYPANIGNCDAGGGTPAACTYTNHFADPDFNPIGDPRVVSLFIVPDAWTAQELAADAGSSKVKVLPVNDFAYFYVTGWAGQGQANPCESDPAEDVLSNKEKANGYVVGHFISYVDPLNEGGAGEDACDFSSLGGCVAVLTR